MAPWGLHDFRRTISTRLHEAGVAPHIVEALLAHVGHKAGVAGTYNLAKYREQKREALELWSNLVRRNRRHRKWGRKLRYQLASLGALTNLADIIAPS